MKCLPVAMGAKQSRQGASAPIADNLSKRDELLRVNEADVQQEVDASTLESTLNEAFVADYLLRHSESEFSSENVAFLLLLRRLFDAVEAPQQHAGMQTLIEIQHQLCKDHVQPGATLLMAKRGVPKLGQPNVRGDQYVTVKVTIPKQVSGEEKELVEKLDKAMTN